MVKLILPTLHDRFIIFTTTKYDSLYFLRKIDAIRSSTETDMAAIFTPRLSIG